MRTHFSLFYKNNVITFYIGTKAQMRFPMHLYFFAYNNDGVVNHMTRGIKSEAAIGDAIRIPHPVQLAR